MRSGERLNAGGAEPVWRKPVLGVLSADKTAFGSAVDTDGYEPDS
ncbi:hypothetical protein P7L64_06470 [Tistrella bauzanensis]